MDLEHYYEKSRLETEKSEIQNIKNEIINQMNKIYDTLEIIITNHEGKFLQEINYTIFSSIADTSLMDLHVLSMFKSNYSLQNSKIIEKIKETYGDFRYRLFQLIEIHKASITHSKLENRKRVMSSIHELKSEIPQYITLLNKN